MQSTNGFITIPASEKSVPLPIEELKRLTRIKATRPNGRLGGTLKTGEEVEFSLVQNGSGSLRDPARWEGQIQPGHCFTLDHLAEWHWLPSPAYQMSRVYASWLRCSKF